MAPRQRVERTAILTIIQAYALTLTLIPARLVFGPLGAFGAPASLVGLLAFALWLTGAVRPDLLQRVSYPVRIAYAALWIPTLLSYGVMHLRGGVPGDEVNAADRWVLFLAGWTGVALLGAEGLRSRDEVLRVLRVTVAGVASSAFVAMMQSYSGIDPTVALSKVPIFSVAGELASVLARAGLRRPAGTATHPIEFGCILALTIGTAAVLAFKDRDRPRWYATACVALIGVAIPVTISRSAIIGSAIAVTVWLTVASNHERRVAGAFGAGGLVIVFVTLPGLLGTLRNYFLSFGSDDSISTRTGDYAAVADFVRASPWIGRGPATFLPKYRILDNQWVATLIETGVVGVIGLAMFFGAIGWLGLTIRREAGNGMWSELGATLGAAALIASLMAAFFDMFAYPFVPGLLALLYAASGALHGMGGEDNSDASGVPTAGRSGSILSGPSNG